MTVHEHHCPAHSPCWSRLQLYISPKASFQSSHHFKRWKLIVFRHAGMAGLVYFFYQICYELVHMFVFWRCCFLLCTIWQGVTTSPCPPYSLSRRGTLLAVSDVVSVRSRLQQFAAISAGVEFLVLFWRKQYTMWHSTCAEHIYSTGT